MKKIFAALFFSLFAAVAFAQEQIVVYAAASVTNMMDELMAAYNKANGTAFVGSYAASGTLARQIKEGAPAAIFISADPKWMDELEKDGLVDTATRKDYLGNELVLIAPGTSKLSYGFDGKKALSSLLKKGDKFAIGDPAYVPAGQYAQNALTKLGEWDNIKPALIMADNVRVVLAFVERGEAALGAVYSSDAGISSKVKVISPFPADSYPAIRYPIAIIKSNKNAAVEKFYNYITSDEAKKVIAKYGFSPL